MNPSIISQEQILTIAGNIRFQQGIDDSQHHQVEGFQFEGDRATATINCFDVSIHYKAKKSIEGACSCPDSEGFDFCRHCVCLVLYANKVAQQLVSLSKGPDKSKVLAYLLTMDKQSLAKQCLELIEQDQEQFERFLLKASLGNECIDYAKLKSQVTQLTRHPENLFSQRQVKHFFSKIDRFLEELALSNYQDKPAQMIKIIEYTFQRINRLLHKVDDATGQRSGCIKKLRDMHAVLFMQLTGRPATKAKKLYALWLHDRFQLLGPDIHPYLRGTEMGDETDRDMLGQTFTSLAETDWQHHASKLKPWQCEKIARLLMEEAIKQGNLEQEQRFRTYLSEL